MRKRLILIILLLSGLKGPELFAQIPNAGFETWWVVTNGNLIPAYWLTLNSFSTGSFYPVTRDTDHYPANTGSVSIRIESSPSQMNNSGYGYAVTANSLPLTGIKPGFVITGHPTSMNGYYKFFPHNGDTMVIQALLFKNGSVVADAGITQTVTTSSWKAFTAPFPPYVSADSAAIVLSTFYTGHAVNFPKGNSVMYVDNLSFDNLTTGLNDPGSQEVDLEIYPNPISDKLNCMIKGGTPGLLNLYDAFGRLVLSEAIHDGSGTIDLSEKESGIYFMEVISDSGSSRRKIIKH